MDTIKIAVTIPLENALAAGRASYGDTVVELNDESVTSLSEGARKLVASALRRPDGVLVPPHPTAAYSPLTVLIPFADAVANALEERSAAYDAIRREQEEREAVKAAKLAAERACVDALTEMAKLEPDLARAAQEGYEVRKAMVARITNRLISAVCAQAKNASLIPDERSVVWRSHEVSTTPRGAPTGRAFAVLDIVAEAAESENARYLPDAVGKWQVSRVVRAEISEKHFVTAVTATLQFISGEIRQVIVSTEGISLSDRQP